MSKFKMLKGKNHLKDYGEKGSQQGEGRIPSGADRSQGLQSSLNLASDSFSRYRLSSSRKLWEREEPTESGFESTPWG